MDPRRQDVQKAIYLHAKQLEYMVPCPPCRTRGRREPACVCGGKGKVPVEIAEQFSVNREGERS